MKREKNINLLIVMTVLLLTMWERSVCAQAFDAIARTTTGTNTDLILIQTNSAGSAGQKFTRSMTVSNFLEMLESVSNWTGGSGGSASISTNADQFGATNVITIKSGSLQTNNQLYGTTTVNGTQTNVGAVGITGPVTTFGNTTNKGTGSVISSVS